MVMAGRARSYLVLTGGEAMRERILFVGLVGAVVSGGPAREAVPRYRVIELAPDAAGTSEASDVNNAGVVAGHITRDDRQGTRAAVWDRMGVLRILSSDESAASGINDSGQVTGWIVPEKAESARAVVWYSGSILRIPSLPGALFAKGRDINVHGEVVGISDAPTESEQAFLFRNGLARSLPRPARFSEAAAVNDRGIIAGAVEDEKGRE